MDSSRLIALERLGVVSNYQEFTVLIVGVGGVGSIASEMLARCGIGKLVLIDYDKVEAANLNRLFYKPNHIGLSKCEAAKIIINEINPDVKIESYNLNVSKLDEFEQFYSILKGVNLLLACVDNYEARMAINQACNEIDITWIESGVSENAMSGHIQFMIPGVTACYACAPPLSSVLKNESTLRKEGVCAASLPTTVAIIAGLLVQNCLKFLLQFGHLSFCLSYQGLTNHFAEMIIKPNKECQNSECRKKQVLNSHKNIPCNFPNHSELMKVETSIENEHGIELIDEQADGFDESQVFDNLWESNLKLEDLAELRLKLASLK